MKPTILKLSALAAAIALWANATPARAQRAVITPRPVAAGRLNFTPAPGVGRVFVAPVALTMNQRALTTASFGASTVGSGAMVRSNNSADFGGALRATAPVNSTFAATRLGANGSLASAAAVRRDFPPISLGLSMGLTLDQILHTMPWSQFFGVKAAGAANLAAGYRGYVPANAILR